MDNEIKKIIRVGSRKSELALIQTNFVVDCLKKENPEKEFTIVTMTTLGDRILNVSLPKIGEKSLFTKDLEDGLRNENLDFVVHSLKDLPTTLPDGLAIGAVFEREDPRDALVLNEKYKELTLESLPSGAVVGTSSLRRTAQIRSRYPQLKVTDVRGNMNTRLRKLDAGGEYAALLLANAGLIRMGWRHRVAQVLPCAQMLYAVGQGALAVECRANDASLLAMLAPFNHAETYCRVLAERSFLKTIGGGCSAPVGVSTMLKSLDAQFQMTITGAVWSLDGTTKLEHTLEQTFDQIKKTHKHKLSPTEESENKKIKIEHTDNPIEVLNRRVTDKVGQLHCEDVYERSQQTLYCGLHVNTNVPIEVIVLCDNFGKDLAKSLIGKGALEVMKVAHDSIRSSIIKKP